MKKFYQDEFLNGKLLLIDKPLGWTSFDVVNYLRLEIRKSLDVKKIKIGHAGTLDPLATGLMLICTGKLTKKISFLQDLEKEYIGRFFLGATTPSFDKETNIDKTYPTNHITEDMIKKVAKSFLGEIEQTPPKFSAVKIKGRRAYDYARQGEEVKIKSKIVNIAAFDITDITENIITFRIRCSKGTYVRAIAEDLGKKLNSGAYLSELRRTAIGEYLVCNAILPEEFVKTIRKEF